MATDAFGRLRVSGVHNLFEYKPSLATQVSVNNLDVDIWVDRTDSGGTITYNNDANAVELAAAASGDSATRITKQVMPYQSGKSRLFYFSCAPISRVNSGSEVFTARVGVFSVDASNNPVEGHWFETDGLVLTFVHRYTDTSTDPDTVTDVTVTQSSWNIDLFDGAGPSGKSLSASGMTSETLFVMDQEWLGAGRFRVGFNIEGVTYYAHQFVSNTAYPYTTTPRLPIVYQLDTTTLTSPLFMRQVCCTCVSEGGYTPIGRRCSVNVGVAGANLAASSTKYVVMAVKLQTGFPTGEVHVLNLDACYPGGSGSSWTGFELQLHSTNGSIGALSESLTFTDEPHTTISVFRGASSGTNPTVTTDGYIITSICVVQHTSSHLGSSEYAAVLKRAQITQYDTLVLAATVSSGSNKTVGAALDLVEFT